ncbi:MAG: hypothetical protein K9I85_13665 [Saprospiraceae bacterium]|nr:hypothetical protein [Saprospiraceae bacterium]
MTSIRTLVLAISLTGILLAGWEMHCRSLGFLPTVEDDKHLWAEKRTLIRDNDPDQVLIIGASRAHFDFQLNEWEELTGIRPLMLAANGKSPGPVLQDIIENTAFNGTIVMNITPSLFFIAQHDSVGEWHRAKEWVDFYYSRTWAQRLNHCLSYAVQPYLAFLTDGEEGDPDLKSLLATLPPTGRTKPGTPFPRFSQVESDRNTIMLARMETDTAFQKTIQNAWATFGSKSKRNDDMIDISFPFYLDLIKQLKDRGGKMILTFNPSSGFYTEMEGRVYPRAQYFDAFVKQSGCPAYHFNDYPLLDQFSPPEWSHLCTPDARVYTREILTIMKADGVL